MKKLKEIEGKTAQQLPLEPGMFFYSSWGYDQTNIDFLEVVEVSPTKKTVLCRMVGKDRVSTGMTSDNVSPDNSYRGPTLFRLRVSAFQSSITLRGSYPFCEHYYLRCKLAEEHRQEGKFSCPIIESENYFWWAEDRKRAYCKDCKHCFNYLSVDYREGSFSKYDHPMYETALGFGH